MIGKSLPCEKKKAEKGRVEIYRGAKMYVLEFHIDGPRMKTLLNYSNNNDYKMFIHFFQQAFW